MYKSLLMTLSLVSAGSIYVLPLQAQETCIQEEACDGTTVCASPENTSAAGPFTVGAKTVTIEGLRTEVWYPSSASPTDANRKTYDVRSALPLLLQAVIPPSKAPIQLCDCYDSLALDKENGPYPVLLFAHGSASFRTQSLSLMTHLASRGFVVLAVDHPGLQLADSLQGKRDADVPKDLRSILEALQFSGQGDNALSFLKGSVQLNRVGLLGHSAGGGGITALGSVDGVKMLVPMAAGGVSPSFSGTSLILGALDDKVVPFSRQEIGFEAAPTQSKLIGIGNAGHLAFADLCTVKNAQGQNLVELAADFGLPGDALASKLWDGCENGQLSADKSMEIVRYAVTAAAETALQCKDRSAAFNRLLSTYPGVKIFQEK